MRSNMPMGTAAEGRTMVKIENFQKILLPSANSPCTALSWVHVWVGLMAATWLPMGLCVL